MSTIPNGRLSERLINEKTYPLQCQTSIFILFIFVIASANGSIFGYFFDWLRRRCIKNFESE